jgi:hypothetical protein
MSLFDQFEEALTDAQRRIRFGLARDVDPSITEMFDPITLLNDLIEAEIPFPHVVGLWEAVLRKLESFNGMPHLTDRQLHVLVAKFILEYPNHAAAQWVSRYTDIYQLSPDQPAELPPAQQGGEELRPARSASIVKGLVEDFLCQEFEVEAPLLHELIDSREIVEMTNRMVRIIRFTGLQTARAETLRALISDTANFSQKSIIPARMHDMAMAARQLDRTEAAFRASMRIFSSDLPRAAAQYQLALELLGRLFLLACIIPPYTARRQSFSRMASLLSAVAKPARQHGASQTSLPLAIRRLEDKLATQVGNVSHLASRLVNATSLLSSKHGAATELRETAIRIDDSFRELLSLARGLYKGTSGIGKITMALRAPRAQRADNITDAVKQFADEELGLSYKCERVAGLNAVGIQSLSDLRQHAECLRIAKHVLFIVWEEYALPPDRAAAIARSISTVRIADDEIGIVLVAEEPSEELRAALQKRQMTVGGGPLLWMDRNATVRTFSRREGFLVELDKVLAKTQARYNVRAPGQLPSSSEATHPQAVEQPGNRGYGAHANGHPSRLFICYAHSDKKWRDLLDTHFRPYVANQKLTLWSDVLIMPGEEWREQISSAINAAHAAILLVSPEFLRSDFVANEELPRLLSAARTRGLEIYWVYVSQCAFEETWIGQYQASHDISVPLDTLSKPKRNKVLTAICKKICGGDIKGGP